jgi:hypothetical protein
MRVETWVSLALCLIGAAVPLAWVSPHLPERPELLLAAGVAVMPFAVVAGTAWAARFDRRTARSVVVVVGLVLAIALGGWWWAAQDHEGFTLMLAGLLFVPGAQLLVWLGGAIISGRWARHAEPGNVSSAIDPRDVGAE